MEVLNGFYGDSHYEYDQRGNRVCERRGKGGKLVTHYQYDCLNQLIQVDNGEATTRYEYDALGRRVSKTSTIDDSPTRTEFLWNDDVLLSERYIADQEVGEDGQGGREQQEFSPDKEPYLADKTYLFEPGTFKPLAFVEQGKIYHYHLDHLGTPQEISNAQGKLVWSANYKAYGSLALADNPQVENNLRFQGQYFDEETGLHYNRFRYYDPEVGRFTQQDPIGLLGGINNYKYVVNPVQWTDPLGLTAAKEDPNRQVRAISRPKEIIPPDYDPLTDSYEGSKFYSKSTVEGGRVHVSTDAITQNDFARIVDNSSGQVDILTGTHGTPDGDLVYKPAFYDEDFARWGGAPNVNVHDVSKMSNSQIKSIIDNKDTTICAWCFSEKSKF
ncbi:RHS repeat-associated core domain-containing protein [Halioxenophilus aromaticivorans]|uniref:RHS protein conserved region domain-containing protein n=1 Tax=Halioxenophilus aromaticivorans TaxID=1306992 RepID=A0AAV3U3B7_9ALTE